MASGVSERHSLVVAFDKVKPKLDWMRSRLSLRLGCEPGARGGRNFAEVVPEERRFSASISAYQLCSVAIVHDQPQVDQAFRLMGVKTSQMGKNAALICSIWKMRAFLANRIR
jgi:hypothetical protein